jgi:hypothetical protein
MRQETELYQFDHLHYLKVSIGDAGGPQMRDVAVAALVGANV